MNNNLVLRIVFTFIVVAVLVLPFANTAVMAQNEPNYFAAVNPTTPDSPIYTTAGSNWTVSFEAVWSYGDYSGTSISNATVTVQVSNSKDKEIDTLSLNTTTGIFSFNYSSSAADVLTFTPIKLVTQDGTEYETSLVDTENNVYGLQSKSVVVWWDTFHVSLVSYDTEAQGAFTVSVNVTYLLLPEEGMTLPEWATYSHQTFLPKVVQNATVIINGVTAEETSQKGVFTANLSTWLPTAYVHVGVLQEGWTTADTGLSFAHNGNKQTWVYAMMAGLILIVIALLVYLVLLKKAGNSFLSLKNYPILGGITLTITAVISLYWGLVGLDSTLKGFDWIFLTLIGMLSFGFPITAAFLSLRKKNQTFVISTIIMPIFTNVIAIKSSLDTYELAIPWLIIITSFVLSFISAVLICNSDEEFAQHTTTAD